MGESEPGALPYLLSPASAAFRKASCQLACRGCLLGRFGGPTILPYSVPCQRAKFLLRQCILNVIHAGLYRVPTPADADKARALLPLRQFAPPRSRFAGSKSSTLRSARTMYRCGRSMGHRRILARICTGDSCYRSDMRLAKRNDVTTNKKRGHEPAGTLLITRAEGGTQKSSFKPGTTSYHAPRLGEIMMKMSTLAYRALFLAFSCNVSLVN